MRLGMCLMPRLELRLEPAPHSPLKTPELTQDAVDNGAVALEECLSLDKRKTMVNVESALLDRWNFRERWGDYLDKALISHANAALSLKWLGFDAVIGIESAGVPYADIFRVVGFPMHSIDYSHHKRKMKFPEIEDEELEKLRKHEKVLLCDVDIVG